MRYLFSQWRVPFYFPNYDPSIVIGLSLHQSIFVSNRLSGQTHAARLRMLAHRASLSIAGENEAGWRRDVLIA